MSVKEAINVVEQALDMARKAGIYSFGDSTAIYQALLTLVPLKEAKNDEAGDNNSPAVEKAPKAKK